MNWEELKGIKRFTPLSQVFGSFGQPKFRLESLSVYYMGKGYFITFSERKFHVVDGERGEVGEVGEFAVRVTFFESTQFAAMFFKVPDEHFGLANHGTDLLSNEDFEVLPGIYTSSSFKQASNDLRNRHDGSFYREGENMALVNGEFIFTHQFIYYGNIELYFGGKTKNTPMSGFRLNLYE